MLDKDLYYFKNDANLDIDFIMKLNKELTLIEVKASNGNAKSLRTVLNDV